MIALIICSFLRLVACERSDSYERDTSSSLVYRHYRPKIQAPLIREEIQSNPACRILHEPLTAGTFPDAMAWQVFGQSCGLHLTTAGITKTRLERSKALAWHDDARANMSQFGYVNLGHRFDPGLEVRQQISRGIDKLDACDLPQVYIMMFDEAWSVLNAATEALSPVFGLAPLNDFWVFNVKPGQAGWGVHRDRPGTGFQDNGMPRYTTVWTAITDADDETSFLYTLPKHGDNTYEKIDKRNDDLQRCLYEGHQHVHAMPVKAGTTLAWTSELAHWGTASPLGATSTRQTLTTAMAVGEGSVLRSTNHDIPSFGSRAAVLAYQQLRYNHNVEVPALLQLPILMVLSQHGNELNWNTIQGERDELLKLMRGWIKDKGQGVHELSIIARMSNRSWRL